MVYDPMANLFSDIIGATKMHASGLLPLRLFDALAIEWHTHPLGMVSVQLVAQKLGARRSSPRELFRASRPRTTLRAPPRGSYSIGARSALIRQVTQPTLIEPPDAHHI